MQVSVEESGAIERKVTVSIPHTEVDQEIEKRLRDVARQARIPGFRPGKAPQNVINKRYGAQVTNEVISDTINSSYREALGKEEIVPAGLVSIEPKPFVAGDDLQYVATIELYPEIPSPTLAGRTIEKPVCEVTTEDVDRTLEDIRQRNADFKTRQGKSEKGDRLTIDFEGKIDGESFAGGSTQDHQFVLGEGQMLEQFETGLVGIRAGESKQIAFTFPDDYPGADVAGKAVDFAVTVKAVDQQELLELSDGFAEKLGIKEGGMEKMREEIEISLNRELATRMRSVIRDQVMDELRKVNEIEVPKALVEAEIDRAVEAITRQMEEQGVPKQEVDRERYAADARNQVTLGLIARDIIDKSELKVDGTVVRERVEEMATGYDDGDAFVNWYYSDPARLQQIEAMVLEEKVVNHMLETAEVTEKKVSFREFMNPQGES